MNKKKDLRIKLLLCVSLIILVQAALYGDYREVEKGKKRNVGNRNVGNRIEDLRKKARSSNEAVRISALRKLIQIKDKKVLKILEYFLNDPNWMIRKKAMKGIGSLGYPQGVKRIIRRLRIEKEIFVQKEGIISLGKLKDERARMFLRSYLKNPNFMLKLFAKKSLLLLDN